MAFLHYLDKKKGAVTFGVVIFLNVSIYFFLNNPLGHLVSLAYSAYAAYDACNTCRTPAECLKIE
ncbi:MAG: hypothetical protein ABS871_01650 [Methanobrevibacter sp.]